MERRNSLANHVAVSRAYEVIHRMSKHLGKRMNVTGKFDASVYFEYKRATLTTK